MIYFVDVIFDVIGLNCFELVMMLYNKVCDLVFGGLFKVIVIDFLICCDIFKFCVFFGYELVEQQEEVGIYFYWICKKVDQVFCGFCYFLCFSVVFL